MIPPSALRAASFAVLLSLAGCGASAPVCPRCVGLGDVVPRRARPSTRPRPPPTPLTDAGTPAADLGATADVVAESPPPTTGAADIERWLATGAYRAWRCEAARTPGVGPQRESHLHQRDAERV